MSAVAVLAACMWAGEVAGRRTAPGGMLFFSSVLMSRWGRSLSGRVFAEWNGVSLPAWRRPIMPHRRRDQAPPVAWDCSSMAPGIEHDVDGGVGALRLLLDLIRQARS